MASAARVVVLALLGLVPAVYAAPDAERTVKQVRLSAGSSATVIKGSVKGYRYVDYQVRAGAGQRLKVSMRAGSRASYFNVLPPESQDAAMFIEGAGDKAFDGMLPDDGVYTVRVYLMRSAARRNETSNFMLSVAIEGKPLSPLSVQVDARVPGTRYHATGTVACAPAYTQVRECRAGVIRRGPDGTATVELRWDKASTRRILFVKGRPESADVPQAFTFSRNERGDFVLVFDGDERFEIPEALVYGG